VVIRKAGYRSEVVRTREASEVQIDYRILMQVFKSARTVDNTSDLKGGAPHFSFRKFPASRQAGKARILITGQGATQYKAGNERNHAR
jgi:hypothetical protein